MWLSNSGLSSSHMNARRSVLRVFAKVSAHQPIQKPYIASSLRTPPLCKVGVRRKSAKYEVYGRSGAHTLAKNVRARILESSAEKAWHLFGCISES